MASNTPKLLFIDTNIWLDFYRARNSVGLKLLKHVEAIRDKLIVTYQLESEFKSNRQQVLMDSWSNLKPPIDLGLPNIVADAQTTKMLAKHMKEAKKRVDGLKRLLLRAMTAPARHDPVYQACQRLFHRDDDIVLTRENGLRREIRRKAYRRFLQGYPPRKKSDTSMGDAFNWEWMVHCATERKAELVIVTRDSDFGVTIGNASYLNDHLRQEFHERVSKRRKIVLYSRLTDGLKHLRVAVSQREVEAEGEWVGADGFSGNTVEQFNQFLDAALKRHKKAGARRRKAEEGDQPQRLLPAPDPLLDEDTGQI